MYRSLGLNVFAVIIATAFVMGCSGSDPISDIAPSIPNSGTGNDAGSRYLWGMWNISVDLAGMEASVEVARNALGHFDVTDYLLPPACPDCIKVKVNSFDPFTRILDADVTLRNPVQLPGFDVRGILYTNDYGHMLTNADSWTGLWDIPGGEVVNPFKNFHTYSVHRRFAIGSEVTVNYMVYIPVPPVFNQIQFAVDASWPANCKEPYRIGGFYQSSYPDDSVGTTGDLKVTVQDWQKDVSEVRLIAPEITGTDYELFTQDDDPDHWYWWSIEIANNVGAPGGDYEVLIEAFSSNSGSLALYNKEVVKILPTSGPENPLDVTPEWLNFAPEDVCIEGDYAYVAGGLIGFYIFDISDPTDLVWVSSVDISSVTSVTASGGYAYVASRYMFYIVDVDPPESAYVVGTIGISGSYDYRSDVAVSGNYAYVTSSDDLEIIDISTPDSPEVVNSVVLAGEGAGLDVAGGYAYVADGVDKLHIVDIDPPASAYVVNSVYVPPIPLDVIVANGYAYMACKGGSFRVVDVDPPESANLVGAVGTSGDVLAVDVAGDYAFVTDDEAGLRIIGIENPESPYLVHTVETPGNAFGVEVTDAYAYILDFGTGIQIADITTPASASIVNTYYSLWGSKKVVISGDYAYAADRCGLGIVDISVPKSAAVVNAVITPSEPWDVAVDAGYAFLSAKAYGLYIIDIDPVESAHLVYSVAIDNYTYGLDVDDGYAYLMNTGEGLVIVDVDPPDSAYIAKSISGYSAGYDVAVQDEYAYACSYDDYYGDNFFSKFEIKPLGTAKFISKIQISTNGKGVFLDGLYAYVAGGNTLIIINIDPLQEFPNVVTEVDDMYSAEGVAVDGGYGYVAGSSGFTIADIDPPETAMKIGSGDTPSHGNGVAVSGDYAYVAYDYHGQGGMRIFYMGDW